MDSNQELKTLTEKMDELLSRVQWIQTTLKKQQPEKAAYSVGEFAKLVDRRPYTVREWCREGRIHATKLACGRGEECEWSISHAELLRYQTEKLLPRCINRATP